MLQCRPRPRFQRSDFMKAAAAIAAPAAPGFDGQIIDLSRPKISLPKIEYHDPKGFTILVCPKVPSCCRFPL